MTNEQLLPFLEEVLRDVECELAQPEVCELITMALDRKITQALRILEEYHDG